VVWANVQRRGIFEEEVRLDARGPNLPKIDLGPLTNGLKQVCAIWAQAGDVGVVQRPEIGGGEVKPAGHGPNIDLKSIWDGLQWACAAWTHAKDAGIVQRRGILGEEVRLDARGPNIDIGAVMNGLQMACATWTHAKDAGIIQRRETFGDEVTLNARRPRFTLEELKARIEKVRKTITAIKTGEIGNLPEWEDFLAGKNQPTDW